MIHDAARPLVPPGVVVAAARAARRSGAAIVAVPCDDTLKFARRPARRGGAWSVVRTVPRDGVWRVQTPQVFRRDLLERAFARAGRDDVTDECGLMERIGVRVAIVPGSPANLKVTTPGDLSIARALVRAPAGRTARRRAGVSSRKKWRSG
jgi:2-C-methyl-D-erythritol 4-phosphate cytidylyltransferase